MVFTDQPPEAASLEGPVPSLEGPVPSLEGPVPSLEDIVGAFVAVMARIGQHFFHRSAEFDLSPQQAKAFHELRQPLSMGELADRLFCDASNVTGIVDRLEARGLVERQLDPDDRRVRRLVLTPEGRELWQAHHDRVFESIPCLAHLGGDDRRTLCGLLTRMADGPEAGS